jgi:hypothetical protein
VDFGEPHAVEGVGVKTFVEDLRDCTDGVGSNAREREDVIAVRIISITRILGLTHLFGSDRTKLGEVEDTDFAFRNGFHKKRLS